MNRQPGYRLPRVGGRGGLPDNQTENVSASPAAKPPLEVSSALAGYRPSVPNMLQSAVT